MSLKKYRNPFYWALQFELGKTSRKIRRIRVVIDAG
jgi:hypothetical protein